MALRLSSLASHDPAIKLMPVLCLGSAFSEDLNETLPFSFLPTALLVKEPSLKRQIQMLLITGVGSGVEDTTSSWANGTLNAVKESIG